VKQTLFLIKLLGRLLFSVSSIFLDNFFYTIKHSRALSVIYLLLLAQVVVVAISQNSLTDKKNLINENQTSSFITIHQEYLEHQNINEKTVESIIYCQELLNETNHIHSVSRNELINCGLFYLSQEKYQNYTQLIAKAKKLDPNWIGWNQTKPQL